MAWLTEAEPCLRKDKCEFMIPAVKYLIHIIDVKGKLKAAREAPTLQKYHRVLYSRKFLIELIFEISENPVTILKL